MKQLPVIAAILFSAGSVSAASFDCQKASTQVESAICMDNDLSFLDDQMAEIYNKVLNSRERKEDLRAGQREWISKIRNSCKDTDCLSDAYLDRIESLEGLLTDVQSRDNKNGFREPNRSDQSDGQPALSDTTIESSVDGVGEGLKRTINQSISVSGGAVACSTVKISAEHFTGYPLPTVQPIGQPKDDWFSRNDWATCNEYVQADTWISEIATGIQQICVGAANQLRDTSVTSTTSHEVPRISLNRLERFCGRYKNTDKGALEYSKRVRDLADLASRHAQVAISRAVSLAESQRGDIERSRAENDQREDAERLAKREAKKERERIDELERQQQQAKFQANEVSRCSALKQQFQSDASGTANAALQILDGSYNCGENVTMFVCANQMQLAQNVCPLQASQSQMALCLRLRMNRCNF